jgi:hypothetical protein
MNFQEKRQNKKMAKIFTIIGYIMIVLFIVGLILTFSTTKRWVLSITFGSAMICLMSSIMFMIFGMAYTTPLIKYRMNILEWRQRNLFIKIIELIIMKATELCNQCTFSIKRSYFLRGLIVQAQIKNKDLNSRGMDNLDNIMKNNDPKKVTF